MSEDDAPELRRRLSSRVFDKLNPGGRRQSSLMLIQTALGAGFLTLSFAMKSSGLVLGLSMLVLDGAVVYFGIEIMLRGAVQMKVNDTASLLSKCVGAWSMPVLDALLIFYGMGAVTAYFILLGDFIPGLLKDMEALQFISPLGLSHDVLRSRCILASLLVVVPLSIPETLSALRFATPVGLIAVISTSVMIICNCPSRFEAHFDMPDYGAINLVTIDYNIFKSFSILVFAYNCHMNIVPVASELRTTSNRSIGIITGGTVSLLVLFYGCIGAGGYLSFLSQTKQNVLLNYGLSPAVTACRFLLCLSLTVAIPCNLTPTIKSILSFFKSRASGQADNLQKSLLTDEGDDAPAGAKGKILAVKAVCLFIQVCVALVVTNIADVMAFLGAIVGTALMMGIPLAVLLTLRFEDYSKLKFGTAVLVLGGSMLFSTAAIFVLTLQKLGVLPEQ